MPCPSLFMDPSIKPPLYSIDRTVQQVESSSFIYRAGVCLELKQILHKAADKVSYQMLWWFVLEEGSCAGHHHMYCNVATRGMSCNWRGARHSRV